MKKRLTATILSVAMLAGGASAFAGCAKPVPDDRPIDPTKTQLYVGNYDGGVGGKWLDNAAARFEEKQKGGADQHRSR